MIFIPATLTVHHLLLIGRLVGLLVASGLYSKAITILLLLVAVTYDIPILQCRFGLGIRPATVGIPNSAFRSTSPKDAPNQIDLLVGTAYLKRSRNEFDVIIIM